MKIVWNYIFIITGLCLFLQFAGIQTGFAGLFNLFGITTTTSGITGFGFNTSNFFGAIFSNPLGILLALGTGAILGFFTRATPENFIILPFITGTLYLFISVMVSIVQYGINYGGYVASLACLIMIPITVGLANALVDYFRGGDF